MALFRSRLPSLWAPDFAGATLGANPIGYGSLASGATLLRAASRVAEGLSRAIFKAWRLCAPASRAK